MNPTTNALRAGLRRGVIELRATFTNGQDLWTYFFPTVVLLVAVFWMRGSTVPGTDFSLGARTLPSALGMGLLFGGLLGLANQLVIDREDGTLLRAKAIPDGMLGYLVGKIVLVSAVALIGVVIQLTPGLFFLDGLRLGDPGAWLTLAWVVPLGLVATLPLGAVIGSLIENPRNMGLVVMPIFGLIALSGIFYPINGLPGWLQGVAQVFPLYWLGLGMRSALLPGDLAAVELGGSWRHLETVGVLGAWAVLGLVLAPVVLRRMARRESGSRVAARRERAMQRVG
ncbi:ABC transporter permease [Micromonospora chalcea]|uniref:ABC-2 type transport system permease protein n=1 Tax=Micromonospora echinospora TaxID=1877 RepID=A0ABR6MJS3_MICEC|nr:MULTISPECIES: ABC transporter permease [Micromonospora]AXO36101.1 ABC-type multidrug transport system permease component [Micromonospora sp. B006]MBB5115628.1 ABC-2 type transport system permease protein [Micromonospora echinospora]MBQ1045607.1 ABC transporter permease [Micromonospora sp. C72]MBQ1055716.1 ABC transporter permease [Micromonospora sp. C32]OKJ36542.1 ABC transporter [Micromonospora sp. TSRI0369]